MIFILALTLSFLWLIFPVSLILLRWLLLLLLIFFSLLFLVFIGFYSFFRLWLNILFNNVTCYLLQFLLFIYNRYLASLSRDLPFFLRFIFVCFLFMTLVDDLGKWYFTLNFIIIFKDISNIFAIRNIKFFFFNSNCSDESLLAAFIIFLILLNLAVSLLNVRKPFNYFPCPKGST